MVASALAGRATGIDRFEHGPGVLGDAFDQCDGHRDGEGIGQEEFVDRVDRLV